MHAVLYALRMIKQVLQYIISAIETPLSEELLRLTTSLQDLPVLAGLMPSSWELGRVVEGVDSDDMMERLAMLLQEEVGDEEGFGEVVKEGFSNQTEVAAPNSSIGKKKKRKKAKGKKGSEGIDKGKQNNMFRMLA